MGTVCTGSFVGAGDFVGTNSDGLRVGPTEGLSVGLLEGSTAGLAEGLSVGLSEGLNVGFTVGDSVAKQIRKHRGNIC